LELLTSQGKGQVRRVLLWHKVEFST